MNTANVSTEIRDEYTKILVKKGEDGLYRWILGKGVLAIQNDDFPEVRILDVAETFFSLSRSSGDKKYFTVGKILRRAAHKLYRVMLKTNKGHGTNSRFLKSVK